MGLSQSVSGHKQSGFSLLELLLVVVIVAVISGLAVLSVGDRRVAGLQREAEKLVAVMGFLTEEAVFEQTPFALQFVERGYRSLVWNYASAEWVVFGDGVGSHHFPGYIDIEPRPEVREYSGKGVEEKTKFTPDIVFYPDEEIDDFELILSLANGDYQWLIRGQRFKGVELVQI